MLDLGHVEVLETTTSGNSPNGRNGTSGDASNEVLVIDGQLKRAGGYEDTVMMLAAMLLRGGPVADDTRRAGSG